MINELQKLQGVQMDGVWWLVFGRGRDSMVRTGEREEVSASMCRGVTKDKEWVHG